jgi:peptide/nickel transport system permease protein
MNNYILKRFAQIIPALFLVSIAIFLIIHLIPGDPAKSLAGPNATQEQLDGLSRQFGLDQPLWMQYLIWLKNALTGNLGNSFINNYPVNDLIAQRIPATLELAIVAAVIAVLIAFPVGIIAALKPGSVIDTLSTLFSALSFAVPGFWLAIILMLLFSVELHWLPPSGRADIDDPVEHVKSIILPALTLGIGMAGHLAQYLRSAVLDVLSRDYVQTARGKGLRNKAIITRHILRNALIPVITVFGLQTGHLLSGAIIVESVFAWPGIGRLTIQAIGWRDYALLQADVMYIVLAFMLINLATDVAYAYIDPRIRVQ